MLLASSDDDDEPMLMRQKMLTRIHLHSRTPVIRTLRRGGQALFSFLFENNIPAGKAKPILARLRGRDCMSTAKIGPDLPRLKNSSS